MAEPTKKRWLEQHSTVAIWLGWASVVLGVGLLFYGVAAAAGEVDLLGSSCVETVLTETEPADDPTEPAEVQSTESTTTCSPSGILGPAAVPLGLGLFFCFPVIRLLIADFELTFGPFSIKRATSPDAETIAKAEASDQNDYAAALQAIQLAELLVTVDAIQSRLDALPQPVETRRKRRKRS